MIINLPMVNSDASSFSIVNAVFISTEIVEYMSQTRDDIASAAFLHSFYICIVTIIILIGMT